MKLNFSICLLAGVLCLVADCTQLRAADRSDGYQLAQTRRARRARPMPPGFIVPELGEATTEVPKLPGATNDKPAGANTSPAPVTVAPSRANTLPAPVTTTVKQPLPRVNNPAAVEEPPAAGIPGTPTLGAKPEINNTPTDRPSNSQRAAEAIAVAQQQLSGQNYEEAIRAASQAIALDDANAAAYRQLRSSAYASLGRYEEALADHKPVALTVTAPSAQLKTGTTVLATVPAGTKLKIDDIKGKWLKVAAADAQTFDWAWIRRSDVVTREQAQPQPLPEGGDVATGAEPMVLPEGEDPGYDYYGPGPGYDYGRDYYDWWRHVPPAYRRYLPR